MLCLWFWMCWSDEDFLYVCSYVSIFYRGLSVIYIFLQVWERGWNPESFRRCNCKCVRSLQWNADGLSGLRFFFNHSKLLYLFSSELISTEILFCFRHWLLSVCVWVSYIVQSRFLLLLLWCLRNYIISQFSYVFFIAGCWICRRFVWTTNDYW